MALGNALLQAITGSMYKPEENPFGIAGQAIAQGAPYLSNPYGSTGKNALYTVGAGLLAGLLGGIARNQTDSDNALQSAAFERGIKDPEARVEIAKEHPRLLTALNQLTLEEQQREAEAAQKQRELFLGKQADRGYFVGPDGQMVQALDPIADEVEKKRQLLRGTAGIEADIERQKARARIEAESGEMGRSAGGVPNPATTAGARVLEREESMRKEFAGFDVVKKYETSAIGFKSMLNALNDPAGPADIEIVKGGVQAIEPGLAVMIGEQAALEQTQGIDEQLKGKLRKVLNGEAVLDDATRKAITRIAARRYEQYATAYGEKRKAYGDLAEGTPGIQRGRVILGADPTPVDTLWPDYRASLEQARQQGQQPAVVQLPNGMIAPSGLKSAEERLQWYRQQKELQNAQSQGFAR